ncbi:MAG: nuclease-related domain-containing protein, partial [Chloroflexota bacterium]
QTRLFSSNSQGSILYHMDPILYNRLTVDLAYFTILVLFAVVALLMAIRKSANIRPTVAMQNRQPSNMALANIAREAQARVGDLPLAHVFQPAGIAALEDRAATSSALDEIARSAQMRINALPSAPVFQLDPAEKATVEVATAPVGPVIVHGSKYLWESRWTHLPTFAQGREGEERVVNSLVNSLGAGWYIFRNFVLPTKNEDIDVVLVGPGGIYALEVDNYSGGMNFERSRCYIKTPQGKFYRQRRRTDTQITQTTAHLDTFLKDHGIGNQTAVKRLAVVSESNGASGTGVWTVKQLRTRMRTIAASDVLSAAQVGRVVSILKAEASDQMIHASSRVH